MMGGGGCRILLYGRKEGHRLFFLQLANGKRRRMHVAEQRKMVCLCPLLMPTRPQAKKGNY